MQKQSKAEYARTLRKTGGIQRRQWGKKPPRDYSNLPGARSAKTHGRLGKAAPNFPIPVEINPIFQKSSPPLTPDDFTAISKCLSRSRACNNGISSSPPERKYCISTQPVGRTVGQNCHMLARALSEPVMKNPSHSTIPKSISTPPPEALEPNSRQICAKASLTTFTQEKNDSNPGCQRHVPGGVTRKEANDGINPKNSKYHILFHNPLTAIRQAFKQSDRTLSMSNAESAGTHRNGTDT